MTFDINDLRAEKGIPYVGDDLLQVCADLEKIMEQIEDHYNFLKEVYKEFEEEESYVAYELETEYLIDEAIIRSFLKVAGRGYDRLAAVYNTLKNICYEDIIPAYGTVEAVE